MTIFTNISEKLHALVENLPVGVIFIQEERIVYVNSEFARIFETTPEKVIGKNLLDFVAPEFQKTVQDKINTQLNGQIKADCYEFQGLTANNHIITCEMRSQSFMYQGKRAIVGSIIDITARKKQEAELIKRKEKALSASKAKTTFLANMSHEMRTPLNAILGFAKLLEETQLTPKQKECVEAILASVKHLSELVSQVSDISQIEAGVFKIEKKPTDLKKLIEEVASIIKQRTITKGLKFKLNLTKKLPHQILTDPLRLRQSLLNLLHNALKYTEQGYISLSVSYKNKEIIFTIKDTGCGIPSEKLPYIFERFLPFERKGGGLGLGLAITKEIVEKLGGKIRVKSQVDEGSTFQIILPVGEVIQERVVKISKEGANTEAHLTISSATILLVEDDIASQRLIKNILEREGLNVDVVEDGKTALAVAEKKVYDVILMDMRIPKLDGYEVARYLKSNPKTQDIPIIALTANALREDKNRCFEAGVDDYLAKPFTNEALLRILKKYIGTHLTVEEDDDDRKYYIGYLKKTIHAMKTALQTGELDTFLRLAHNLKGSGRAYGFKDISLLGGMLEDGIKKGDNFVIEFLFKKLQQKVEEYGTD